MSKQNCFMFCTQEMNQCNYQYQIPTPDTYYKYQGNRKAYVCQKPKYDVKRKTMPRQQQLLLKCRSECSGNHEPCEDVILLDDNINIYFVISIIYRTLVFSAKYSLINANMQKICHHTHSSKTIWFYINATTAPCVNDKKGWELCKLNLSFIYIFIGFIHLVNVYSSSFLWHVFVCMSICMCMCIWHVLTITYYHNESPSTNII